jgi:beta-lactamase family protein
MTLPFVALLPPEPAVLTRPVITAPAPRQTSFGLVAGRLGQGTVRIVVKVGQTTKVDTPTWETNFRFQISLPPRDVTVRVIAYDAAGNSKSAAVTPVFGLPAAAYPVPIVGAEDGVLAGQIRSLARAYPGTAAVFVQDLRTGRGAAWNARARFQAASTLKLGIAIEVLRVLRRLPQPGSRLATLFRKMLVYSDNQAANDLETWLGGSVYAGADRVSTTLRALHLNDSHMWGGYILGTASTRPIPLRVERQPPYFTFGKYSSAWDLARIHRYLHRAAAGQGALMGLPGSFTPVDARYMLYVLAHVRDSGKLDRYIGARADVAVLHKAGWIVHARHDSGLVFWHGGAFVVTVLTWNGIEAGTSSDVLAGRVAQAALRRFSATPTPAPRPSRLPS